ncbi:MAG TPA: VOC family protein [Acidimicrobiales bacterium]|nr:VOC family protein [Acidimicrobiales bacterium]
MKSLAISHVAMSVQRGTLTDEFREAVLAFYGDVFGWREMDRFRRDDRLTIAVSRNAYVNLRERDDFAAISYEHFGVVVESTDVLAALRDDVAQRGVDVEDAPESQLFRFKHLLPMAIEVQYFERGI